MLVLIRSRFASSNVPGSRTTVQYCQTCRTLRSLRFGCCPPCLANVCPVPLLVRPPPVCPGSARLTTFSGSHACGKPPSGFMWCFMARVGIRVSPLSSRHEIHIKDNSGSMPNHMTSQALSMKSFDHKFTFSIVWDMCESLKYRHNGGKHATHNISFFAILRHASHLQSSSNPHSTLLQSSS